MLDPKNVLAIVVTYHPDGSFADRFERLPQQVGGVLIVDNNSAARDIVMLRETATRLNMALMLNSKNLGLASALNIGVAHAMAHGYKWVLLFDQDSTPADNMFEGLQDAYDHFPYREQLAIIGSNYSTRQIGKSVSSQPVSTACKWTETTAVITSGSLVSLLAYRTLGPFRDDYFVDCVDLEYCLRARSMGFKVIMTSQSLMSHGIGQLTAHRLPWREIHASNHSPIRWYYMARNDADLAKKYFVREPSWVLTNFWTRFKAMIIVCMFEKDRLAKVRYSVMGMWDAIFSRFDRKIVD